jgi:hypothetical protein
MIMLDGMLQVILNPIAFFRKLVDDDILTSRAFGVVLLVMVLAGIYGYFVAIPTADAIANTPFGAFGLITTPISFVVISLLSWLIFGLLVRMAAGINAKPWAITAYSMSPQLIIYALLIVIAVLFPSKLTPVTIDPTQDPEAFQEAMLSLQKESQQTTFGRTSQILSYLSSLWWVILIYFGVREATDSRKALISALLVGVPTLLLLVLPFLFSPVG